jgi:hypothetical protein
VLCTILVSAGVGSNWSGKHVGTDRESLRRVIGFAVVAILVLALLVDFVFPRFLVGAPFIMCIILTVGVLAPAAFLMGMPFPLGLRLLDRSGAQWAELIPWVWGINGATSVLGSILAITIAINFGFRAALLVGLCAYGVAFLCGRALAGGQQTDQVASSSRARQAAEA